ncbi:hypothetical protein QO058_14330 [Bosea vestrisii]|uniref:hypothetical protein n=1 Tax=Bosea vestrisii TaxID=151416 RepID=UPI0024E0204B|nr:hypothetical protein [Bosea vestrisii]WID99308.1 hypothetical protein QO058_14330 [Bosea vestrisii]
MLLATLSSDRIGEGLYLIDVMRAAVVHRCQPAGNGTLWLLSDNKAYSTHTVTREQWPKASSPSWSLA